MAIRKRKLLLTIGITVAIFLFIISPIGLLYLFRRGVEIGNDSNVILGTFHRTFNREDGLIPIINAAKPLQMIYPKSTTYDKSAIISIIP